VFEGFTTQARRVVECAVEEARDLRHDRVGTEHLLLGLLAHDAGATGAVLRSAGASVAAARHKVAEAVPAGGPSTAELPRSARAERALERAARFARQERAPAVGPEHVLLGVLDVEGLACQVLRGLGVDVGHLRDDLVAARSPGPSEPEAPAPAAVPGADPAVRCPACREPLPDPIPARALVARPPDGDARRVLLPYCPACSAALGVLPR
jgi:ATP-dependent Clp protease ATP-binding subunit ClpA